MFRFPVGGAWIIVPPLAAQVALTRKGPSMKLTQQTPNCSDFDLTLPGDETPAYRLLLPEHVAGANLETRFVHTVPGGGGPVWWRKP